MEALSADDEADLAAAARYRSAATVAGEVSGGDPAQEARGSTGLSWSAALHADVSTLHERVAVLESSVSNPK